MLTAWLGPKGFQQVAVRIVLIDVRFGEVDNLFDPHDDLRGPDLVTFLVELRVVGQQTTNVIEFGSGQGEVSQPTTG